MTIVDSQTMVGADTSKKDFAIFRWDSGEHSTILNERPQLHRWLKKLPANSAIAVEATNTYHLDLVELAYEMGHQVFIVDAGRLNKYRESIGKRAKTDASDAELLARYLSKEKDELRPWSPPSAVYTKLKTLLHRRAALVHARVDLKQSWGKESMLKEVFDQCIASMDALDQQIQKMLKDTLVEAGLMHQIKRCEAIEGVGFLTATGFLTAFLRGEFENSDAYIAFLGLDLRVRDSGDKSGRRRLTKKGDPEIRRLGHNAAMAASRSETWSAFYQHYLAKGKAKTQALVILTRKLARVAFSLMKNLTEYHPNRMFGGSPQT